MRATELTVCACETPSRKGGLYRFSLTEEGKLIPGAILSCNKPMYAAARAKSLLALTMTAPDGGRESGLWSVKPDLSEAKLLGKTGGVEACHLSVSGKDFYLVNYGTGSVSKNLKTLVTHEGHGADPERQEGPHTHCVLPSKDGEHLFVTDLGTDTLYLYDQNLAEVTRAKVPAGYGIRHVVESKDGKLIFAVNELSPSVSIFRHSGAKLSYEKTVTIPCRRQGATGAAIRLSEDGRFLFVSIREEDIIVTFRVEGGREPDLSFCSRHSVEGRWPRDFILVDDRFLVAACERSDLLNVFSLKDGVVGELLDSQKLPRPIAVLTR